MREIKQLFDPDGILNPGVLLNDNPHVHLENLKPLPATNPLVDKCIECGFCEAACPSRNLTLTPRQRITVQREISRLKRSGSDPQRRETVQQAYAYQGDQTCAVDGLCELLCPVDINTGELTKTLRCQKVQSPAFQHGADILADSYGHVTQLVRAGLWAADSAHRLMGGRTLSRYQDSMGRLLRSRLPHWNPYMPTPVFHAVPSARSTSGTPVVYFPSCVARTMGPARGDDDALALPQVTVRVLERAGFRVCYPQRLEQLCCGLSFDSKGFKVQADRLAKALEQALLAASQGGRWPVLCDTSPCLYRMRQVMGDRLQLFEPVQFLHDVVLPRLTLKPLDDPILLHVTCSSRKMGLEPLFQTVADACAANVVVPEGIECCGFAGDRGFTTPELNASALEPLRGQVPEGCHGGFTNSRTCEIGLALHSGVYYKSIMYLVERCTR
jgi:D-lactate dehydrogenase